MSITLFRGINRPYQGEKYMFIGLESWTTSLRIAYKFARDEGYRIERMKVIEKKMR